MDIAAPFRLDEQQRLTLRQGGGCLSVFGLPFLFAGLFMLGIAAGIVPLSNPQDLHGTEYLVFSLMGVIFTAVGAGLVLGRMWLTIDRPRGIVTAAWGLLAPMRTKTANVRDFRVVTLRFDEGNNKNPDRYPLALEGAEGGDNGFDIASPTDFGEARRMAMCLAYYLGLPFEDRTSGTTATYDPRAGQRGPAPESAPVAALPSQPLPPRPAVLRSTIGDTGNALEIFIPLPGVHKIFGVFVFVVMLIMLSNFFPAFKTFKHMRFSVPGDFVGLIFFGVFAVFLLSIAINVLALAGKRSRFGTTVIVAGNGVTIREKNPGKGATRTIPVGDIIGIDVDGLDAGSNRYAQKLAAAESAPNPFDPSSSGTAGKKRAPVLLAFAARMNRLVLKTNREIVVFGQGLARDEADYLCALIKRRLGGAR